MAGLGSRFQAQAKVNPEFNKPKPLINIKGHPMITWAVRSLPFIQTAVDDKNYEVAWSDLIFVIQKKHDVKFGLSQKLREIYSPKIQIVIIPELTHGAAETAYAVKENLDPQEELIISDSDHYFDGTNLVQAIRNKEADLAGMIPIFKPPNDGIARWSYSLVDENDLISRVEEKSVELMNQGASANIGAYYFSKAEYFLEAVEKVLAKNEMSGAAGQKEFFVAPLYNYLIQKNRKIKAIPIPQVWGLGTPNDLEIFLNNHQF